LLTSWYAYLTMTRLECSKSIAGATTDDLTSIERS